MSECSVRGFRLKRAETIFRRIEGRRGFARLATLDGMRRRPIASATALALILLGSVLLTADAFPSWGQRLTVALTVVDENGLPIPEARVTLSEPGRAPVALHTDYRGRCSYTLHGESSYHIRVEKPGFYQALENTADARLSSVEVVLAHEQMMQEEVDVTPPTGGIDTSQTSDARTLNTPEIVNIPYPTSRDIRNLLPFNPGVVQDMAGQIHVAGSPSYGTLDLLDRFDIRSPVSGSLSMRVSADAVRSIKTESTRYPVEFGRADGGVIAMDTGMGDDKYRFYTTDFFPSFREINGIRFDKFVPRVTFSGPLVRRRAWFFNGFDLDYDNIYIPELPANADTNHLLRGSNLIKTQINLTSANNLSFGLLGNDYHSPYDGISSLTPQQSTTKRDITVWLPYVRDQHSFANGALLEAGIGDARFRDGYEPHGDAPYELTPELSHGSYFENLTGQSRRLEGNGDLFLPPRYWAGRHDLKAGIDLDHIFFSDTLTRAPVAYLRENGTLLRRSTFPEYAAFQHHNTEIGAYLEDRWLAHSGLLIEPGLRFDWDQILRRPLFSPRLALTYSPGSVPSTKLSAGIGLYHEHTQLEYLTRAFAGIRYDTYYAADGVTPVDGPLSTTFLANDGTLREESAVNWSVGLERRLPGAIYAQANFLQKRAWDGFTYANRSGPEALSGEYLLTNGRRDRYDSAEFDARHTFAKGYSLFFSYTRSSARTNAALDYVPAVSILGPQQAGPLAWDTPNRAISWGWLPLLLPKFRKSWDFVYTLDWRSGFPYTSVNANQQLVGQPGSMRFPSYLSFSPGLEWRFHFRGSYFGLRGVMENATDRQNPLVVDNVVDSPQYRSFSEFEGRAFTARIRLIGSR